MYVYTNRPTQAFACMYVKDIEIDTHTYTQPSMCVDNGFSKTHIYLSRAIIQKGASLPLVCRTFAHICYFQKYLLDIFDMQKFI